MKDQYQYQYKFTLLKEPGALPEQEGITGSDHTYQFLKKRYQELETYVEHFSILGLNQANKPVMFKVVSTGAINATIADIRVIAKYLLDSLCVSFVVCHNHPSGNLTPSEADRKITKKIKEAMQIFDIRMLDHLVLTEEGYYSFADNYDL